MRPSTSRSRGVSRSSGAAAARAGEQLGDDLGVERGAAGADPAHVDEEVGDVGDAVLEQVADARRCRRRAARWRSAPRRTARARGCRPSASCRRISSAARRPSSVWVGGMRTSTTARSGWCRSTTPQQLVGVADGRDDLLAGVDEEAGEPGAQQHGVLGDHDPHGSSTGEGGRPARRADDVHPAAEGGDPVAQARAGPVPAAAVGAARAVVADLDQRAGRSAGRGSTRARVASACRATLVSASATTK